MERVEKTLRCSSHSIWHIYLLVRRGRIKYFENLKRVVVLIEE